jgi:hypothetical protein
VAIKGLNDYNKIGVAYLSTGLGIILIDLEKFLVKDTWRIGYGGAEVAVNGVAFTSGAVYAATPEGTKTASLASDPADHRNWQQVVLPAGRADQVVSSGNKVFVQMGDQVYLSSGGIFNPYYRGSGIRGIDTAAQGLLVSESVSGTGKVSQTDAVGFVIRTFRPASLSAPEQAVLAGSECWIADSNNGLFRASNTSGERVFPNSPINIASGQMTFVGNELWAAAGSVTDAWNYTFNQTAYTDLKGSTGTDITSMCIRKSTA